MLVRFQVFLRALADGCKERTIAMKATFGSTTKANDTSAFIDDLIAVAGLEVPVEPSNRNL